MTLYLGDCLEVMPTLPAASIDLILCDLPYGTTQNKWDSVIPLDRLWAQYDRVGKPAAAMVFTAAEPFMSALVTSNLKAFRYDWIWHKSQAVGHLNAKRMPMRAHENIAVFYRETATYNPQIRDKPKENIRPLGRRAPTTNYGVFGEYAERSIPHDKTYPQSVEKFNNPNHGEKGLHPTQKPISLFEYIVLTYTNEGDTVLDNCMGSGTTGVACRNTNRNFIGIERDPTYFEIARRRIEPMPWELP